MSLALGLRSTARQTTAAGPLHDRPTVVVTAPGDEVLEGPNVDVEWVYQQPQGKAQQWYRVFVEAAGSVLVHDTGWLAGAADQLTLDWETLGLDATVENTITVGVRGPARIGTGAVARYQAQDSTAAEVDMGNPQCTIVLPVDGSVHTDPDSILVAWTFEDDEGHSQAEYRVRLLSVETGAELFTTGWVASDATSVELDYVFNDNTKVRVEVQLKNEQGVRSD